MVAVTPVDFSQLPPSLQELLGPRVERLGYLGDWFRRTAHQPTALEHFHLFTEALKSAIAAHLVEVVALTIAGERGNRYERHQHEQLCRRLGYPDDWVKSLLGMESDAVLADDELATRGLALALVRREEDLPTHLTHLVDVVGEATAVGCLLLAARYDAHASVAAALDLEPPVPSVFEEAP